MIGKVKMINIADVTIEFIDGSTKAVPLESLPNNIVLNDLINLNDSDTLINEKYVDFF